MTVNLQLKTSKMKGMGFTLIEVLISLVIIAISLTALYRATGQDVRYTHRLKKTSTQHWVARQAVNQIQSKLITIKAGMPQTFKTQMFNKDWYWQAKLVHTGVKNVYKIKISVSDQQSGPFVERLTAYTLEQ